MCLAAQCHPNVHGCGHVPKEAFICSWKLIAGSAVTQGTASGSLKADVGLCLLLSPRVAVWEPEDWLIFNVEYGFYMQSVDIYSFSIYI